MKIGLSHIGMDHPPFIVAEIGVNHDGSVQRAIELADAARRAGADAIKLQLFQTDLLLSKAARLAAYQKRAGSGDPFAMLRALELRADQMAPIVERAHRNGLATIVSIFSVELVEQAEALSFDAYKTASPDIINRPLIDAIMATSKPMILSTGAATAAEVAQATIWLGDHPYLLMHCVSGYPTPDEHAALGGRIAMHQVNPMAVGYSDHTTSVDTGALAVAGGACLLEKHFTYDRAAQGPDHAASLEGHDFAEYVRLARRAWAMRGPMEKVVSEIEQDVRNVSRQSLTTRRDLPAGHVLQRDDLTVKRPGTGLSPALLEDVLGRTLTGPIEADMPLTEGHLA